MPRVHVPIGRGQAVVDVLARHCREAEVDVALGQRVDRLLVDGGAVVGVAVGDDEITAGAVVDRHRRVRQQSGEAGRVLPVGGAHRIGVVHRCRRAPAATPFDLGRPGRRPGHRARPWPAPAACRLRPHPTRRTCRAGSCWSTATASASSTRRRRTASSTRMAREQGDRVSTPCSTAPRSRRPTAAGVARYKHAIPGSTKRQSPHWNARHRASDGRRRSDDVGGDDRRAGDRARCAVDEPRRNRRAATTPASSRASTPTTSRTPSSWSRSPRRRSTVPSCARRRWLDGLRPAHRPLRQRPAQRRSTASQVSTPPASARAASSASSTSAAATTTPTAPCSAASPAPRPRWRRRWMAAALRHARPRARAAYDSDPTVRRSRACRSGRPTTWARPTTARR